ncbi:MAG: ATP-binding cassette domain-containing protein, partial [Limnohabitans sp.]|nr:ATP-binding cassette domain-containing protein [Limnohabitans sp.]
DKIAHLQKFINRFKAQASKAKQAQSRVKALERMEKVAPLLADAEFTFGFKEPNNLPNPMLAISEASFGYTVEGDTKPILQGVSKSVLAGQRIGILGANGQGKSTLVKTIARTMPLLAGTLTEGKGLNIGYFAQQELDVLHPNDNPLEHMIRLAKELGPNSGEPSREQDLRNYLGTFNFSGDMVKQAVGSMSGGEKARLVLAMIVWQRPNLLLLDEPTNHLDLATREALSMALNEFEGTVMLVSHDRALLRAVCDEFWMVGRGKVEPFDGDLDDYQKYLLEESKRLREVAKNAAKDAASAPAVPVAVVAQPVATEAPAPAVSGGEQRKLDAQRRQNMATQTRPLKKELDQNEQRMAVVEKEKAGLEALLATPITPGEIADAGRRLKALSDEVAVLEERWLELTAQLEAMA